MNLTKTEKHIAIWLARGKSFDAIRAEMAITEGTLRVHLSHIRQKTGIAELDPMKLKRHMEKVERVAVQQEITPTQTQVLHLLSEGKSYREIAASLNIGTGTAMNHACEGRKRTGITGETRCVYDKNGANPMDDPMF